VIGTRIEARIRPDLSPPSEETGKIADDDFADAFGLLVNAGGNSGLPLHARVGVACSKRKPFPSPESYLAADGFLFEHATSYARVAVADRNCRRRSQQAEGVGEVIIRDFARLLAGRTKIGPNSGFDPGTYHTLILAGISLSGFFINTFIAEGFNADLWTADPFSTARSRSMERAIG